MHADPDLERLIDRELSRLAAPRAPQTLLPRVLRAVEAHSRGSFGGWFTWPLAWQATSLGLMLLLLVGALNAAPIAVWAVTILSPAVAGDVTWAGDVMRRVSEIFGAAAVVWRVLMEPVAIVLVLFLATMCAASAVLGAALRSVVLGGTSRP